MQRIARLFFCIILVALVFMHVAIAASGAVLPAAPPFLAAPAGTADVLSLKN